MRAEWSLGLICVVALSAVPAPGSAGARQTAACGDQRVHCVGSQGQEYRDIQHAVDAAGPGHTVWVTAGEYEGFRVRRSGTAEFPLRIVAADGARITGTEPFSEEGIYLEDVSWVVLEGFVVERRGMPGVGIGAHDARPERPMRGLTIRNNVVRDSGSTNLYLSQVADSVVEGNVTSGSVASHGIYLSNAGSDDTVLRGNRSFGNAKNGIHFNGDLASTGDGLQSGLLVEGNVLHDNAANGLNLDGVVRSTFRNNLVFGNGRHGMRAYAIDGAAGPRALVLINNTIVRNGSWAVKLTDDDGGHVIFNNILSSRAGSLVVANPDFASNHNVGPGPYSRDGERTVVSLPDWMEFGYDVDSRGTDPGTLFLAADSGDFRLAGSSDAASAGVPEFGGIAAPIVDLLGQARSAERPAAGAFRGPGSSVRRGR